MFRIDQILSATAFIRNFREVAGLLSENQEPLLITQRNGRFIVVMDGDFFEGLMSARERIQSVPDVSGSSVICDLKTENTRD